jgi:hypothetical protein
MSSVPRSCERGPIEVMKFPVGALKENHIPRSHERGPVEALVHADAVGSKVEEPAAARLQACGNGEQCRIPQLIRRIQFGSWFAAFSTC